MKRLTRTEIDELVKRLAEWRTPQEMRGLVEEAMDDLGSSNLFTQGGLAFLRDSWIAAEFGSLRHADKVRLVSDNWPDFEIQIAGAAMAFEAVEADDPERRRGQEYQNDLGKSKDDPLEDWIMRAEEASAWLEAVCRKKLGKCYGGRASLVIYFNLSEFGIRQSEVEGCFSSATEAVKDAFEEVWVLWKKQAYLVWP